MDLDVLRRVLSLVDQPTLVACCLASKSLHKELTSPGVWKFARVHKPSASAAAAVSLLQSTSVTVVCSDVTCIEEFLRELIAPVCRMSISIYPEPDKVPRSCQIGTLAGRFAPTLEELTIEWGSLPFPLGLVFEEALPHLRELRVIEEGPDPLRRVEVYFHAEMPKVKNVQLRVMTSDILAHVTSMKSLKNVRYESTDELYEDSNLEGVSLDTLYLNAGSEVEWTYLSSAIARAASIKQLTLLCGSPFELDARLPVRDMCLRVTQSTSLVVSMMAARGMESLVVLNSGSTDGWTVRFTECGSWDRFTMFLKNTEVYVGRWGVKVTIEF